MQLNRDDVRRAEVLIRELTGEKIRPGDTGWLGVMVRALELGSTYKRLWESKHGQVEPYPPSRDLEIPRD